MLPLMNCRFIGDERQLAGFGNPVGVCCQLPQRRRIMRRVWYADAIFHRQVMARAEHENPLKASGIDPMKHAGGNSSGETVPCVRHDHRANARTTQNRNLRDKLRHVVPQHGSTVLIPDTRDGRSHDFFHRDNTRRLTYALRGSNENSPAICFFSTS